MGVIVPNLWNGVDSVEILPRRPQLLPSIPIVGPVLTGLLGGGSKPTPTTTTTTTTTQQTSPPPIHTPITTSVQVGQTPSVTAPDYSGDTRDTLGASTPGGGDDTSTPSNFDGKGSTTGPATQSATSSDIPEGVPHFKAAEATADAHGSLLPSGAVSASHSKPSAGSHSPGNSGSSDGAADQDGPVGDPTLSSGFRPRGRLSTGVLVGIVMASIVVMGLVAFLLRLAMQKRRKQSTHRWWFSNKRTSQYYNDKPATLTRSTSNRSSWSSFVTPFDNGVAGRIPPVSIAHLREPARAIIIAHPPVSRSPVDPDQSSPLLDEELETRPHSIWLSRSTGRANYPTFTKLETTKMRAARDVHRRVRGNMQRRQLGIVGNAVSVVLNPLLGGTTTTQKPPAQTTTSPTKPKSTTAPSPTGNTPSPGNSGGNSNPPASPKSGVSSGNRGGNSDVVAAGGGGTETSTAGSPTASPSDPLGSSIRVSGSGDGTPSDTVPGGTTSGTGGDPSTGSTGTGTGTGTEPSSGTRGGSSAPSGGGLSYSGSGSGTPDNGGSNPSPSDVNTVGDVKANNSRGGVIAAAVILTLLFALAVVIFVLRKRSRARRDVQANNWWFTRRRTSQTYGDNEALHTGNSSRRSSFATTVDHSSRSMFANTAIPPPPPMAEFGRSNGTAPALVLDLKDNQDRLSIGSAGSHNSQFLIIHHRESLLQEATMSARTESFPFPKPPLVDRASLHSKASERSQSELNQDGDVFRITSISTPSLALVPTQPLLPADPFGDNNPFEDPVPTLASVLGQNIGIVHRPFFPQLQDELQVIIGESVRILQSFDDGWALAEKMDPSDGGQGFVPLECFHEVGLLPSLGRTRGSSQESL